MIYTEAQAIAALNAIIQGHFPSFNKLPPRDKEGIRQSTWAWFRPILEMLPENASPDDIFPELPVIQKLAVVYLVGSVKYSNPELRSMSDDAVLSHLSEFDLIEQTELFARLAKLGVESVLSAAELQLMIDNFEEIDFDAEIRSLDDSAD